jgi:hypothetical protein
MPAKMSSVVRMKMSAGSFAASTATFSDVGWKTRAGPKKACSATAR